MTAIAIAQRASGEAQTFPPTSGLRTSGVRSVPTEQRRVVPISIAELHAAAFDGELEALAHACKPIEDSLEPPVFRTVIVVESRPSLPPVDVTAGLGDLLGAGARDVTPIGSVREMGRNDDARAALVQTGLAFPLMSSDAPRVSRLDLFGSMVEVVSGDLMATVQGYLVPVCDGAPPAGTRVVVSSGPHVTIESVPDSTIDWLDRLASGDEAHIAARAIALGLLVLRKAHETGPAIDSKGESADVLLARRPLVCARVAAALADLDPDVRDALATRSLGDDDAARAISYALAALAICTRASDDVEPLRSVAAAAMLQPYLDRFASLEQVREWLASVVLSEPTLSMEVVIAHQAARIRRGGNPEAASMHARLVALACDPRRAFDECIELDDDDLEEVRLSIDDHRESIELPDPKSAEGRTRLEVTPLAQILAVAHQKRLSGTLVIREPSGRRHAMVLSGGTPIRARDRMEVVADPSDLDAHLARITAMAALPGASSVEFYPRCDLLVGLVDAPLVPCAPQAAVLAAARAPSVRAKLRDSVISFATGRTLRLKPTRLPPYSPTEEEAAIAAPVLFDDEPLSKLGALLDTAVPLLAAARFLRELERD